LKTVSITINYFLAFVSAMGEEVRKHNLSQDAYFSALLPEAGEEKNLPSTSTDKGKNVDKPSAAKNKKGRGKPRKYYIKTGDKKKGLKTSAVKFVDNWPKEKTDPTFIRGLIQDKLSYIKHVYDEKKRKEAAVKAAAKAAAEAAQEAVRIKYEAAQAEAAELAATLAKAGKP